MELLKEVVIGRGTDEAKISVLCGDILDYGLEGGVPAMDILTVSAFRRNYDPVPRTLVGSLMERRSISVEELAAEPLIDLRDYCGCWFSKELELSAVNPSIRRIGCIELRELPQDLKDQKEQGRRSFEDIRTDEIQVWSEQELPETQIINRLASYYQGLSLLAANGEPMETVGLTIPGTGNQRIAMERIIGPLITETLRYLRNALATRQIYFIIMDAQKAGVLARELEQSYLLMQTQMPAAPAVRRRAFLSYSTKDTAVAERLLEHLEQRGIDVFYAPRDISPGTDYTVAIIEAIDHCDYFVLLVSADSMQSEHVKNELALAHDHLRDGTMIMPFRIDDEQLGADFRYYLVRQQIFDGQRPPLEEQIERFLDGALA